MGWGEYARSKVPLKLVFITFAAVAINLILIGALQLLLTHRYSAPIDAASLTKMNSEYENCTILDSMDYSQKENYLWGLDYTAYLLETEHGETKLAVMEKHLLFDRYRYMEKFSVDVPQVEEEQILSPSTNFQRITCGIYNNTSIGWFNVGQNNSNSLLFIVTAMIVIEYLAYCFLFRREELL